MTVFDLAQHEGQPYMVTELMGGGDVEGLIENAPDHRIPLDQAIDITGSVCRGLEFAHSKEIVHRDLKPGNVWLTADGTAKIGDFGLAVSLDRSRLTQEGMMVGTVSYMPPEQALGGDVTPRADLYSLGCMLYEMVTGRPPFLGDEAVAIIGQHINTPPVAPTWHNPACPRPLAALILRLTAKDPAERPESTSDVLSALESIDLAATPEASIEQEAHSLDSLAGGVFVGRQREMGELKAALEDALSGRGRLVMLVGEPGIGKTRIASELATYAGLRRAQVLWGRCYEGGGAPPYWPWVQAIRSYVRERDAEELKSEMGSGAADIAEIVSDVRERLPGLKSPPTLEPEQARFRLFDSITTFLKSAGRGKPLILILDDLHWADTASLLLLEFVAGELADGRLLLIGTYRDVEVSRQHPLSKTLGQLTKAELFRRVFLRGLSQEDIGRFIEIVSGITPPQDLVKDVHKHTEGNPLFVTEFVRLLVQEGELTRERAVASDRWGVRIPEGVREVIGRRLDRLSERCNQTLSIASVVGRHFDLEVLDRLIEDLSRERLLGALEEALSARVIEELPNEVGRYQFTHALIQETLSEELSTTRRVHLHAQIGEALEELYGSDAEAHAAELVHHFAEAVTGPEKLVKYSLLAGERALATYGYEEALAHFERALAAKEGQPTDAEMAALLFGQGRAQAATLERHEVRQVVAKLHRAFDYYAAAGDVARAVAVAETPLFYVSGYGTELAQLIARALALVPADSHEAGRLLSRYGFVMGMEEGDDKAAQEAFDRALTIAKHEDDAVLEMRTLAGACNVDYFHLRFQESVAKGLKAIELARRADDLHAEVVGCYWVSNALRDLGELERMRMHAVAMLAPAEKLGDRSWLAGALWVNESACRLEGDWEAAREFSDRGLAVSSMDWRFLATRAQLEYEVGEFSRGQAYLERLLEVMRLTPPSPTIEYIVAAIVVPIAARISGVMDRFDMAEAATEAVLSSPLAWISHKKEEPRRPFSDKLFLINGLPEQRRPT